MTDIPKEDVAHLLKLFSKKDFKAFQEDDYFEYNGHIVLYRVNNFYEHCF